MNLFFVQVLNNRFTWVNQFHADSEWPVSLVFVFLIHTKSAVREFQASYENNLVNCSRLSHKGGKTQCFAGNGKLSSIPQRPPF